MIVDASVVTAALLRSEGEGTWAREVLQEGGLSAPHHLPVEVCHTLRRGVASGAMTAGAAATAVADLLVLPIDLYPFEPVGERVWELRDTVTAYDAWYVALAEALDEPLATLDLRLSRATGPRCSFRVPVSGEEDASSG